MNENGNRNGLVWISFFKLVIVKYHSATVFHFVAVSIKSLKLKSPDSFRANLKKNFTGISLLKPDE